MNMDRDTAVRELTDDELTLIWGGHVFRGITIGMVPSWLDETRKKLPIAETVKKQLLSHLVRHRPQTPEALGRMPLERAAPPQRDSMQWSGPCGVYCRTRTTKASQPRPANTAKPAITASPARMSRQVIIE
jgi:hypothetical protein